MLHADGSVTFPEGCNCSLSDGQQVYLVIEHRSHLPVMSDSPIMVSGDQVTYNFRDKQSYKTFLGDGQKEITPGVFTMFAGNADQAGVGSRTDINATDESIWTSNNGNGDIYDIADFDMSGDVNANDESLWLNNTGKASDVDFN